MPELQLTELRGVRVELLLVGVPRTGVERESMSLSSVALATPRARLAADAGVTGAATATAASSSAATPSSSRDRLTLPLVLDGGDDPSSETVLSLPKS